MSPDQATSLSERATDWRAWLVALLFAGVAFGFYTRHNDFPFYYHSDEPSKVKQVLTGERNFHHPLLLLKSTEVVMALTGAAKQPQPTAEAGRAASAFFAALAVAALVLLAWGFGGPLAGLLAGTLLTLHPVLFELAHYMKEDCALLAGVALCFLGMERYTRRPSLAWAAFAGAAGGMAISGKYVGFAVAAVALLVVLARPRNGRRFGWRGGLVFLGAMLLVFGAINFECFTRPTGVGSGLRDEFERIDLRAQERTFEIKYLSTLTRVITLPVLLAAGFWMQRRWREFRTQPPCTWAMIVFPLIFTAAMSVLPVTKERYLLPVFALFCVLGALGIAEMLVARPFRRAGLVGALLAVLAIGWQVPALVRYAREFSTDDRRELIVWMREHLPPQAIVAYDKRARLDHAQQAGHPAYFFPQETRAKKQFAAELGTLTELRTQGILYVVACEPDFHRALNPGKKPGATERERAKFYEELFAKGKLLWERPGGKLQYLHPGLRLYEVP